MTNEKLSIMFRQGYEAQKSENYELAIEKISEYSNLLPAEISHEPYYWLSQYYLKLNQLDSAVESLQIYADGCGDLLASKVLKEVGKDLEEKGFFQHAKILYITATKKNSNIGLTTTIKNLEG